MNLRGHYSIHHNHHAPFQGEGGGFENSGVGKGEEVYPTHTSLVALVEVKTTWAEVALREGRRDLGSSREGLAFNKEYQRSERLEVTEEIVKNREGVDRKLIKLFKGGT